MRQLISFIIVFSGLALIPGDMVYAAHILEPLGTEIAATPPRGRVFGQIEYVYANDDPDDSDKVKSHSLPLELEIGIGERTQINLEADILMRKTTGDEKESGIEEVAFGLKHRFFDETETLPDAAFLVEFSPGAGLKENESEVKGSILLTKNFTNMFLTHLEIGYILETEKEDSEVDNSDIYVYNIAPIYRAIPDKLLLMAELNGKHNSGKNIDDVSIAPEAIFVFGNNALKVAVPVGVSGDANDLGFKVGVSRLF